MLAPAETTAAAAQSLKPPDEEHMLQLDAFALSMGGYVSGWAVQSSIKAIEKRTRRSRRAEE